MTRKRIALSVAVVCIIAGGSLVAQNLSLGIPAAVTVKITPSWHDGLTKCPTEDSLGPCYWDGGENGEGRSFIVTEDQEVVVQ